MPITLLLALAVITIQCIVVTGMSYMSTVQPVHNPTEVLMTGLYTLFIVLIVDVARTQIKSSTGA